MEHMNHDMHKHTHRENQEIIDLTNRLNRLEGQVRGIKTMVESDVYCDDILIQVAAVKSALDAFASQLFAQHIKTCVIRDIHAGKAEIVDELMTTVKKTDSLMDERKINVEGMTCSSCEQKVTSAFKRLPGVKQVSASYQTGFVYIQGKNLPEDPQLEKVIAPLGYHVVKATFPWKFVALLSFGMIVYFGVSILYGRLLFDPTQEVFSFNLIIAYGLVSSLHCIGMCGSIAMGTVLNRKGIKPMNGMWSYQVGRLISYTVSGLILGALGEVFTISTGFKNGLLLFAGIWMLALALQMAGILKVKLPSFTFKTKNKPYGSFIVGLLNALMPCGSLQTMQIIALSTTNMWLGGTVMLIFGLTTAPSLMMMQWFATRLSAIKGQSIKLISALIVAMMGFQIILQSPYVYQPVMALIGNVSSSDQAPVIDGTQVLHLKIVNGQYKLDANTVKVNQAVKIIFDGYENSLGCANPLILTWSNQKIDILKNPQPIIFTPTKTGRLEIHCWMNMVRTYIKVIE